MAVAGKSKVAFAGQTPDENIRHAGKMGAKDDDMEVEDNEGFVNQGAVKDLISFNPDAKSYLTNLPEFTFYHQDISYHIQTFIEQEVEGDADSYFHASKENLKKDLIYLAFTESRAETAVSNISENLLSSQNAAYWATNFLNNWIFCKYKSKYRHKPLCQDVWLSIGQKMGQNEKKIDILNVKKKQIRNGDFFQVEREHKLYFHGTDWHSVDDILKHGIVLNSDGFGRDFSFRHRPGFYVSDNFDTARQWAESKAACPAVIVFCVKNDVFQDKSVHADVTEMDNRERYYMFYRSSGQKEFNLREETKNWKTITGPMLLNPCSEVLSFSNDKQMCIADREIASKFHASITKVVYYAKRNLN